MIEIVSLSESASRLTAKVEFDLRNGAKSVWIVDPEERRVDLYAPDRPARGFRGSDTLTDPVLRGFTLPLSELFDLG